jgi:hypothetical protein
MRVATANVSGTGQRGRRGPNAGGVRPPQAARANAGGGVAVTAVDPQLPGWHVP